MGKMEAAEQSASEQPLPSLRVETATLRQLSTELQQGWIERLFSRLASLYGASFGRQWEGTNLPEVKTTWAEKLGGFTAAQIGEALRSCDDRQYPPNLPEFLDLCRQAARRGGIPPRPIEPRPTREELEARQKQLENAALKPASYDYRLWAKQLRERYIAGEHLDPIQITMASEALYEVWENRQCTHLLAAA